VGHYEQQGQVVAERGELGLMWGNEKRSVATAFFGLDQGVIFPRFWIAPPKLNGGKHLFFSAQWCCSGVSVRAFQLDSSGFESLLSKAAEGKRRVCLTPSAQSDATLHLRRPLSPAKTKK
jgi:hypothetical protein